MSKHVKYFEFDMLEKHFSEEIDHYYSCIWLAILLIVGYTIYKLIEKYDR